MVNNLKINKQAFKKKVFSLCIGLSVLGLSLTGCGINNITVDNSQNTQIIEEERDSYPVRIEFNNFTKEIAEDELITFYNDNGEIYNGIGIDEDGKVETNLFIDECKIVSHTLNQKVQLPKTDEEHTIVIEIDYITSNISTSLESLEKQK